MARILNLLGCPGRRTTMTNAKRGRSTDTPTTPTAVRVATQKVVIINGSPEVLELLETVLDAGHYDIIFVESSEHAYSQIKRVKPDLVILCVSMNTGDGLQVLSMLKLDEETRSLPIVTYTTERAAESEEAQVAETSDTEIFAPKPAAWMNGRGRISGCTKSPTRGKGCYSPRRVSSEKRDRERIPILGELHGEVMVFEPMAIKEISHGGVQVETGVPLQLDSLHDFRLTLGDRSVIVKGRVVHCSISDVDQDVVVYRSGVEFVEPSERIEQVIDDFMQAIRDGRRSA